jgi:hypothetical protein
MNQGTAKGAATAITVMRGEGLNGKSCVARPSAAKKTKINASPQGRMIEASFNRFAKYRGMNEFMFSSPAASSEKL